MYGHGPSDDIFTMIFLRAWLADKQRKVNWVRFAWDALQRQLKIHERSVSLAKMEPSRDGLPSTPTTSKQSTFEDWVHDGDDDDEEEMSSCYMVGGRRTTVFLLHQLPTVKSLLKDTQEVEIDTVPRRMELRTKQDALKQLVADLLAEKRLIER